jgi:hypothetical protein
MAGFLDAWEKEKEGRRRAKKQIHVRSAALETVMVG